MIRTTELNDNIVTHIVCKRCGLQPRVGRIRIDDLRSLGWETTHLFEGSWGVICGRCAWVMTTEANRRMVHPAWCQPDHCHWDLSEGTTTHTRHWVLPDADEWWLSLDLQLDEKGEPQWCTARMEGKEPLEFTELAERATHLADARELMVRYGLDKIVEEVTA